LSSDLVHRVSASEAAASSAVEPICRRRAGDLPRLRVRLEEDADVIPAETDVSQGQSLGHV
jgi:hypothetical protein